MIDIVTLAQVLNVPINVAVLLVGFWLIDRRLVRIETRLGTWRAPLSGDPEDNALRM
jgi:hypothetical protein